MLWTIINCFFLSWWHLKAKNLAKGGLWDELEKFSKSKKSLIGYEVNKPTLSQN